MKPTAMVTGGAAGIGKTIVETLLRSGWRVAALDCTFPAERRDGDRLELRGDVGREPDVADAVRRTVETFGSLHALVNNAGIGINRPMEELSLDEWNRVIGTNLTGTFLCSKHAAPHLRATNGCIVNIASTRAFQSESNTEAYSASKGGIVALTHAMAISLGPDIRVNCISPGWIDCRPDADAKQSEADKAQHPCGRVGTPADIAALVEYLLSDKAGYVTGQNFTVDGGMTKKMIYAP